MTLRLDVFNEKILFNGNGESLKKQDQSHPALVHPGILQTTIIHEQERPDNHDHRDHDNKNKIDDGVLMGSIHYHRDHDNKNKIDDDALRSSNHDHHDHDNKNKILIVY